MEVALTVAFFLTHLKPALCSLSDRAMQCQQQRSDSANLVTGQRQPENVRASQESMSELQQCLDSAQHLSVIRQLNKLGNQTHSASETGMSTCAGDPAGLLPRPETRRQVGIRWPQQPCQVLYNSV